MLKHIPGKTNTKADILSRKDQVNTKEDNKDVQLLKDKLWQRRTTAEIAIMGENKARKESGILKEIRRIETREKEVIQALERNDSTTWEEDGLVYMEGRIYVPNNKNVKIVDGGLYFIFSFHFYFTFLFFFFFYF